MLQTKQDLEPFLLQSGFSQGDVDRFLTKIDDSGGPKSCWEWAAGTNSCGYGQYCLNRKMQSAHRLVCNAVHGIPKGQLTLHSCDNPPCCNPTHLKPGTNNENKQEAAQRLGAVGQKLTASDVRAIRCWLQVGYPQREIADAFGVDSCSISNIKRGYSWSHLKDEQDYSTLRSRRQQSLPRSNQSSLYSCP